MCAIARGVPVIKDNWVEDSIRAGYWINPQAYLVEKYQSLRREPHYVLKNLLVCILHSTSPNFRLLQLLVRMCGARVTDDPTCSQPIDFYMIGDFNDLRLWILRKKMKHQALENSQILSFELAITAEKIPLVSRKVSTLLKFHILNDLVNSICATFLKNNPIVLLFSKKEKFFRKKRF